MNICDVCFQLGKTTEASEQVLIGHRGTPGDHAKRDVCAAHATFLVLVLDQPEAIDDSRLWNPGE